MRRRSLLVWAALALCGIAVLGAMSWLTGDILAAERERAAALTRADLEERTRLGLWRLDALGSAIILRENRHPPEDFRKPAQAMLESAAPEVWLHFSVEKNGALVSPEAQATGEPPGGRLEKLRELLRASPLPGDEWMLLRRAALLGETAWQSIPKGFQKESKVSPAPQSPSDRDMQRQSAAYQDESNFSERVQRAKALTQAVDNALPQEPAPAALRAESQLADSVPRSRALTGFPQRIAVEIGRMRAVWLGEELFLLRETNWEVYPAQEEGSRSEREISIEGVWMNVPKLREQLLGEVRDLLPGARLVPVAGKQAAEDPMALVSFPFRLERGEAAAAAPRAWSRPLIVGWAAVLTALFTATLLVQGVIRLSERRASFVSAVTHEMRTPLTTFRLYSEMLEKGVVKNEKRADYLRVLSREADRLSHLVENVLSFSRIERGSARSVVRETEVADLLEPVRERLESRLAGVGMRLEMAIETGGRVRVDVAAVEHILFNLIDNAAKYAAGSEPPEIRIEVQAQGKWQVIHVRDHGPGIPADERRRIFRAFHKSAHEAAESRPGVGLGLALSRRLAKSLGGRLDCVACMRGAHFELRLPACR